MYSLVTFPASFGMPSHSPYCVKAMALLNMAAVPWEPEYLDNPARMPYRKLPVLRSAEQLIPESDNIRRHLETHHDAPWAGLSSEDLVRSQLLSALADGILYLSVMYERWMDDRCWPHVKRAYFGAAPAPLRLVIPAILRRQIRRGLIWHGFGRLSAADRLAQQTDAFDTISAALNDKSYLLGHAPSPADASVAPMLDMLRKLPADTAVKDELMRRPTLLDYIGRVRWIYA